jgi:hypothetical protein
MRLTPTVRLPLLAALCLALPATGAAAQAPADTARTYGLDTLTVTVLRPWRCGGRPTRSRR